MISPEILRRYPFFAGLNNEQLILIAGVAEEKRVDNGYVFFRENEELKRFYLVLEGAVSIIIEVPDRDIKQPVSKQLLGEMKMRDVTISTVGSGNIFGYSGLIPPHCASAAAKALSFCRVIEFDTARLMDEFEKDCAMGFIITQRAAQVIANRLRDMRIETLAFLP